EVFGKELVEHGFLGKAGAQMVGNLGARAVGGITDLIVDQGREVLGFEEKLTRFGIAARRTPEELAEMRKAIRQVSNETGLAADQVLTGARAYVDLAGAESYSTDMMRTLARAAQAGESSIGDMATVVY